MAEETTRLPAPYVARAKELGIELQPDGIVQKKTLAALEGVTSAAVSKWINAKRLTGALIGEGRKAKVNLILAFDLLRKSQNINHTGTQRQSEQAKDMAFADDPDLHPASPPPPPPITTPKTGAKAATAPVRVAATDGNADETAAEIFDVQADESRSNDKRATLSDYKTRKACAEALLAEQKAMEATGEWITRDDHVAAISQITGDLVAMLENLPMRLGEHFAGQFDGADQQTVAVQTEKLIRKERERFTVAAELKAKEAANG